MALGVVWRTGLVDDLLIAGHQLGVGEGVQHWPGAEEVVGVTVRYEDRVGSFAGILHPRRQAALPRSW